MKQDLTPFVKEFYSKLNILDRHSISEFIIALRKKGLSDSDIIEVTYKIAYIKGKKD